MTHPALDWRIAATIAVTAAISGLLIASAFGVSSSEARRMLQQGGVRLDGEPVANGSLDVEAGAVDGKILQLGKRRFVRVEVE